MRRMTEQQLAEQLQKCGKAPAATPPAPVAPKRPVARATQRTRHVAGTMNKTEAKYQADVLEPRRASGDIDRWWFERITLKLADDTRYTADFIVQLASGELELHEVKGFMEEDARVKCRVAAEYFPFRLYICRFVNKAWEIKEA